MAATTNTIEFKIGKSGQFIVVYFDNKGNREIVDLKPKSYVHFEINSSVPYREFFIGGSDHRGFSCPVIESDESSLFGRLLMAFNEWLKNLGMPVEFGTMPIQMKILDDRFFGFYRDREILYVDLSEVISAKDGVVRFVDGSSITPCRGFYNTIQEKLYLSDDLNTF